MTCQPCVIERVKLHMQLCTLSVLAKLLPFGDVCKCLDDGTSHYGPRVGTISEGVDVDESWLRNADGLICVSTYSNDSNECKVDFLRVWTQLTGLLNWFVDHRFTI